MPIDRNRAITRTTLVGALVNLTLSALKILAGILGHSQALVADGLHSLSDLLSDGLVLIAGRQASEAPDQAHPYGHGRFETVATLLLALLLIGVGVFIGWDAGARLFTPAELEHPNAVALAAILLSIGAKEWLYWWTLSYAKRVRSSLLRANAWHHRSDSVSSLVVLVGIGGTMVGLPYLDAIAAVIVALMIAAIGWKLGWGAIEELVDTALDSKQLDQARAAILSIGGVCGLHLLRTRLSGGRARADVHVVVEPRISVSEGHMISIAVERRLKREISNLDDVVVHIDPEDDPPEDGQTGHSGATLPLRAEVLTRLESQWSAIPIARKRQRVILHYIGAQIEVDVFFSLSICQRLQSDSTALAQRLNEALRDDAAFGQVHVYFG